MPEGTALDNAYIEKKMKQFKLVDMRSGYMDLINEAEQESLGYKDFLIRLLQMEENGKDSRRTEKLLSRAGFETSAALSDIDYGFNPSLEKDRIE